MDTLQTFLDTIPEPMQQQLFEELKSKYEPKTKQSAMPTDEELDLILSKIRK
jgi:hypothetical protein